MKPSVSLLSSSYRALRERPATPTNVFANYQILNTSEGRHSSLGEDGCGNRQITQRNGGARRAAAMALPRPSVSSAKVQNSHSEWKRLAQHG